MISFKEHVLKTEKYTHIVKSIFQIYWKKMS